MNSIIELLEKHSSVRKYISGKKIPEQQLLKIMESAQRASSSYNLQLYSVISVTDEVLRKKVAELCANQSFIEDASDFFIFCADLNKMETACNKAGYVFHQKPYFESTLMSVIDASLAAENAAMAAESMGLGICYIGAVRYSADEIIKLLELPRQVFPLFGLCIGYPLERNKPKPRLPYEGVFFKDKYDTASVAQALKEYDHIMAQSRIYEGRHFPEDQCERIKPQPETGEYGWIEHSARRVSTKKPEKVRPELKKQFENSEFGFK